MDGGDPKIEPAGQDDGMRVARERLTFVQAERRIVEVEHAAAGRTAEDERAARRRRRLHALGTIASATIFVVSLVVLWRIAHEISWQELKNAFAAASLRQLSLAALFTATSYLLLTGYDFLALKQLAQRVPYRTTALASFTSYAVSFTLGFPLLTAGTVRFWIYSARGVKASMIVSLTVIAGLTFWLGMTAVLAWCLIRSADAIAALAYTRVDLVQAIGLGGVVALAGYFVWVSFKRRAVTIQGWRLELPGVRLSLGQMLLGVGDVCAAAGVLFVLLPGGHNISFETFLAIYVFACMLGIASHAPGGLGVFEATMLIALSGLSREGLLGALLLFRLIYYLIPFVLALALLGAYEIKNRLKALSTMRDDNSASC
ncbi:lysylphosphatidylglycerol synthase domain-containing protein [Chelatococcus sp. SYSU_G07232]|uniref:Lysylphosphatidylglycerol synthase domain-containing protein n=1 Tax=Chelatococcus albus TaxID=3047466 RepID=A0ABT7AF64_9HYPH|nr:lysylphosphatidylglycerol synthase domain-containing protein [Chelatococcus sp. SYSU_G07232]MDJ1158023.1 lysylphosphatidylglycerol synthase domain-containing protein [Chelatococcus sp. SYSU_G07232]